MKKRRTPFRAATLYMLAMLLVFDVSSVLAQQQSPNSSKDAKNYAALTKVPVKARARGNPLKNDPKTPN